MSTTRRVDGLGIGLPIAMRLAALIGATLTIVSEPGRGTRVSVHVPADSAQANRSDTGRLLRASGGPAFVAAIVVLMVAAAWMVDAAAEHDIASARNLEINRTAEEARESVLALRETVSRTLDQIDLLHGLAALVVQARHTGNEAMERDTLTELTRLRGQMGAHVRQVALIAASGYVEWTNSGTLDQPVFVGDREHFQAIANGWPGRSFRLPCSAGLPMYAPSISPGASMIPLARCWPLLSSRWSRRHFPALRRLSGSRAATRSPCSGWTG